MHQVRTRRTAAGAIALGMFMALTACSGSSGTSGAASATSTYNCEDPNSNTTIGVSLAALPILSTGAIYAGIEQDFFSKHGLDVTIDSVSTLPASIAAAQGGASDFAFAGTFGLMQAWQNGVPLTVVAPYAGIEPGYYDKMKAGEEGYKTEVTALLTMEDSGLDSPGDLSGKTVAVSDSQGQAELTTRYVIDQAGGDSDSVNFTVLSPADAYNALIAGQVDAAYSLVPIVNNAEKDGAQIISWPNIDALREGPTSVIVATDEYITENPDTVTRFNCALRETTTYATENPDEVRKGLATALNVDPTTYDTSVVPYFYESVDVAGIEKFEKLMLDYGYLTSELDLEPRVHPVAK